MKKMPTLHASSEHASAGETGGRTTIVKAIILRLEALLRRRARYQPEKYYMRGPGPKWHQAHDDEAAAGSQPRR